ncbi:hypothetical protein DOTSEDRAFT_71758 [Dothistroma septosporum NZE10]|uniref:Uncharacterized protein n=1 Tax=Dothistroma septosporum (strain NZE10 / CBS 128990) TaxID=675120 RepID=N1PL46_DOTSN|nr:hypothetical protein DOTSEDRAFT_71758 [Dothistroma septosporum NZE10]
MAFCLEVELQLQQLPSAPSFEPLHPTAPPLYTMAIARGLDISDHYPIELQYIKALFMEGQYRKCIQACRDIAKLADSRQHEPPLQKAFISFYEALAHDEVARSMHQNSITKLPCYESAELLFVQALNALPSHEDARLLCGELPPPTHPEPVLAPASTIEAYRSPSTGDAHFGAPNRLSRASSAVLSSPPIFHRQSPALQSPFFSPRTPLSDTDDLESHESFSELLTPTRLLNRDFSRISLLDLTNSTLPRATSRMSLIEPQTPQRKMSVSQGLMRPIRPGSPARQFDVPPTLPYSGAVQQMPSRMPSRLPQLATRAKPEARLEIARVDSAMGNSSFVTCSEPVSPLSPNGSDVNLSDASTVSALSPPLTPTQPARESFSTIMSQRESELLDESKFLRFADHLHAMRIQLETHIMLVQQAQERLRQAHAERRFQRATQPARSKHNARDYFSSPAQASPKNSSASRMQQARSFWSFIPEDIKTNETKRRIQAGRNRGWRKERFQPKRYQELCESALAEL